MKWLLMFMLAMLTACSSYSPQYPQALKSAEEECASRGGIRGTTFYAAKIRGRLQIAVTCKDNVKLEWAETVKRGN